MKLKILLLAVVAPIVAGFFGEELSGNLYRIFVPLLFGVSIVGSMAIIRLNQRTLSGKSAWYIMAFICIAISALLLYLFYNFHPGF